MGAGRFRDQSRHLVYKLGKDVTTYLDMKNVLGGESKDEVHL